MDINQPGGGGDNAPARLALSKGREKEDRKEEEEEDRNAMKRKIYKGCQRKTLFFALQRPAAVVPQYEIYDTLPTHDVA